MDRVTLENFRCFREEQEVHLAPLTLLVGENSTGKTSFMALIRALWDEAFGRKVPDFKELPYDLGSFDDIAHHRGRRGGRADSFDAGFDAALLGKQDFNAKDGPFRFEVTFGKSGTAPVPVRRRVSYGEIWIEESIPSEKRYKLEAGTSKGSWERKITDAQLRQWLHAVGVALYPFVLALPPHQNSDGDPEDVAEFVPRYDSPPASSSDLKLIYELASYRFQHHARRPFASAPVRSRPRRTYDPSRPNPDPEGDYVPMYLASEYFRNKKTWPALTKRLEDFGRESGLFDEISVKPLGKGDGDPFQVQIRKFGRRLKGPPRNLIDMGYGVSQALPMITELLREDAPAMFLLQQPEVHLHPSAQAALGSLFCSVAETGRQLLVETHSDYLMDRVRMDVRDLRGKLKPEDVSILFFERDELDVRIHSIRMDDQGNILGAPDGYRKFFMEETRRSVNF